MRIVSVRMLNLRYFIRNLKIVFPIVLVFLLVFSASGWCRSNVNRSSRQTTYQKTNTRGNPRVTQKNRSNRSSYDKSQRLRNKAKKWERMSPQKQDELRHRMDRYKSLPSEERKLYQKRYQQLQQLPPEQQQDIRRKLRKMDRLTPEEKEEIRRKFE